jgi:hypothetical protein
MSGDLGDRLNSTFELIGEKKMELIAGIFSFMDGIFSFFNAINFETIAQLTMLAMIVIAGPVIVFLLAASRGNL